MRHRLLNRRTPLHPPAWYTSSRQSTRGPRTPLSGRYGPEDTSGDQRTPADTQRTQRGDQGHTAVSSGCPLGVGEVSHVYPTLPSRRSTQADRAERPSSRSRLRDARPVPAHLLTADARLARVTTVNCTIDSGLRSTICSRSRSSASPPVLSWSVRMSSEPTSRPTTQAMSLWPRPGPAARLVHEGDRALRPDPPRHRHGAGVRLVAAGCRAPHLEDGDHLVVATGVGHDGPRSSARSGSRSPAASCPGSARPTARLRPGPAPRRRLVPRTTRLHRRPSRRARAMASPSSRCCSCCWPSAASPTWPGACASAAPVPPRRSSRPTASRLPSAPGRSPCVPPAPSRCRASSASADGSPAFELTDRSLITTREGCSPSLDQTRDCPRGRL